MLFLKLETHIFINILKYQIKDEVAKLAGKFCLCFSGKFQ